MRGNSWKMNWSSFGLMWTTAPRFNCTCDNFANGFNSVSARRSFTSLPNESRCANCTGAIVFSDCAILIRLLAPPFTPGPSLLLAALLYRDFEPGDLALPAIPFLDQLAL